MKAATVRAANILRIETPLKKGAENPPLIRLGSDLSNSGRILGRGAGIWDEKCIACCVCRHRRSDRAARTDGAGVSSPKVAPTVDQILSLKRAGVAGDLARRPMGRLHGARDELGRQRVRNRDLAGRRGERRERGGTSADERRRSRASRPRGRRMARRLAFVVGPDRQAADLPDQSAWRAKPRR